MTFIFQIILTVFFLVFARLCAKDAKNGIYAVLFLLPLYLVRFSLRGIPTTALEIMIYILFISWALKNKKHLNIFESARKFYRSDKILAAGTGLLFLGAILSMFHSSDLRASLGILKGWFADPFLFFIIFTSEIKTRKQIVGAIWSFVLSGFAVALIAVGYALNNIFTFDGRLRAFYESPNYLAMYLAPAFLFAVYLFTLKKSGDIFSSFRTDRRNSSSVSKLNKVGSVSLKGLFEVLRNDERAQVVILFSFVIVIFLTKSYGAVLGIMAALFFFFLKKYKNGNRRLPQKNQKALLILAAIVLVSFSFLTFQKYEQIVNSNERSSLHSRLMIWEASKEMLKDSPVFGIGPGTFQENYLNYQSRFSTPYLEWAVAEPHNTLLAFYLQSGVIGLSGLIIILLWLVKRARTGDIIFLFLVYFLVHGLVDTLYWKNDLAMIFWVAIGLARALARSDAASC